MSINKKAYTPDRLDRPLYKSQSMSLIDRIREDVYYDMKESKESFIDDVSKSYRGTIDLLVKARKINVSLAAGTLASITFNILSTHYAKKHGYDSSGINWGSYWGESIPNSLVFGAVFLYNSVKEGKSLLKSGKELVSILPVSFSISILPYRLAKNFITNELIKFGLPAEASTPISQMALLIPYGFSLDYTLKKLKYFKDNPRAIARSIKNGKERVTNGTVKIVRDAKYRSIKRRRSKRTFDDISEEDS